MFFFVGSLWATWKGRPPWASKGSSEVRRDEEADDERHCAVQGARHSGTAGITNRSGEIFSNSTLYNQSCTHLFFYKVKYPAFFFLLLTKD